MKRICQSLFLIALLFGQFAPSHKAYAQTDKNGPPYVVDGVDCRYVEHIKALLDFAAIAAGNESTIILIARLGDGERSRKLSQGRLNILSDYLIETRKLSQNRVVTAQGERVSGMGQVEVYVGGKLYILFKMKRNLIISSSPCPPEG